MNHIISTYPSAALKTEVTIHVLLPKTRPTLFNKEEKHSLPFKTLYLLHGAFESPEYFMNKSDICTLVDELGIAVVMPFLANSFYINSNTGEKYFDYITEELKEYCEEIFPLSKDKENTFIGGISMGGYGAIRAALLYPGSYGKVFSLSCAVKTRPTLRFLKTCGLKLYDTKEELLEMENNDKDLFYCVKNTKTDTEDMPEFYMACGESDFFYKDNNEFVNVLKNQGIDVEYKTSPGNHQWNYWGGELSAAIKWLAQA